MKKGDSVTYNTLNSTVRAVVETMHQDGDVTVHAMFHLDENGKDIPGYLGFSYRIMKDDINVLSVTGE